jgi:hypothetical protein
MKLNSVIIELLIHKAEIYFFTEQEKKHNLEGFYLDEGSRIMKWKQQRITMIKH